MNDVRREGMSSWLFTFNWFVKWKDYDIEKKHICAFFVGR